jgi:Uncharacterized conserved protein
MEQAKKMYSTIVKAVENIGWHGDFDEEQMRIELRVRGDDLPMIHRIHVRPELKMVSLFCTMPFSLSQERMMEGAFALCYINDMLTNGSFDLDVSDGAICFRYGLPYMDSIIGPGAVEHMIGFCTQVVDEFNDSLMAINGGLLSVEDFINKWESES